MGTKHLIFSELTAQELEFTREEIRNLITEIPLKNRTDLSISDDAVKLAELYITEGALTNKSYNDALHIALATLNNADVLASWNFKHIHCCPVKISLLGLKPNTGVGFINPSLKAGVMRLKPLSIGL